MRSRVGLCLVAVLGMSLALAVPARAQTAEVSATDNEFSPREIDVSSGTTVTWTNNGDAPHTVTADNGSFDSGNMDPGDEFSETFVSPGRYPYYCEYHGGPGGEGMAGVVVVSAAGGGGQGNGDGDDGDVPADDPADTAPTDTASGDTGGLPATGTPVDAFFYLAIALIAAGVVLLKLGSPKPYRS